MDKIGNRTEIKQELNEIAHLVVRTVNGNFVMPTILLLHWSYQMRHVTVQLGQETASVLNLNISKLILLLFLPIMCGMVPCFLGYIN